MPPAMFRSSAKALSGRYLSLVEREEIALLKVQGHSMQEIGRRLGRAASTVSRELRRNAATRGGGLEYRATTAQWHADLPARPGRQRLLSGSCSSARSFAPRFLPTFGHPHAVALRFARCDQLTVGLAPIRVRPCWAHKGKEIAEALPEHPVRGVPGPCEKRPVDVLDARICAQRDLAARRNFKRQFTLADHVEVKGASFENGLLFIDLQREIPEPKKPRRIAINGVGPNNVAQIEAKAA